MLDVIKEQISQIKKEHKLENHYLASVFLMCTRKTIKEAPWQIDFYNKETKNLTSFKVINDQIHKQPESEAYKHPDIKIKELEIEKVETKFEEVYDIALKALDKKNDDPKNIIIILQNIDNKPIWNISFITVSFSVYNIKIDAVTKETIKENYESLLNMRG